MKPEITLKYLQYLRQKKNGEEGVTLIEMLVVVIIIGILAAAGFPLLLGQIGKSRESEAISAVGTINRAQQAYHYEKGTFSGNLTDAQIKAANALGVFVQPSKYYELNITGGNDTAAVSAQGIDGVNGTIDNGAAQGTRNLTGAVAFNGAGAYGQVMCQADVTGTTVSVGTPGIGAGSSNTCPDGTEIK